MRRSSVRRGKKVHCFACEPVDRLDGHGKSDVPRLVVLADQCRDCAVGVDAPMNRDSASIAYLQRTAGGPVRVTDRPQPSEIAQMGPEMELPCRGLQHHHYGGRIISVSVDRHVHHPSRMAFGLAPPSGDPERRQDQSHSSRQSRVPAPDIAEFGRREDLTDVNVHEFRRHRRSQPPRLSSNESSTHAW
jgi:hypothetical protein